MPSIGEPAIKATPSEEYAARKLLLTDPQVRFILELAEESIAVDPWHRVNRIEIDGIVYDKSEPGIMLSYVVLDGEVLFLTFRDLFNS